MRTRLTQVSLLAIGTMASLTGCQGREDPNGVSVYVTGMLSDTCTYDDDRGGVTFRFNLAGHEDADLVGWVHRPRPPAGSDRPGPAIAVGVFRVRGGEYDNPVTIVAPLDKSDYDAGRVRCVLQTETYGPHVVRKDGRTAAPSSYSVP